MHPCRDRQRHRTLVSNTEAEEIRWKTTRSPEALPTLLHPYDDWYSIQSTRNSSGYSLYVWKCHKYNGKHAGNNSLCTGKEASPEKFVLSYEHGPRWCDVRSCVSAFVYFLAGTDYQLWTAKKNAPIFYSFHFLDTTFSQSSLISAVFISCERFYAVYWPLKHKTLSTRAYGIAILMVWSLAILVSIAVCLCLYLGSHKAAVLSWMSFPLSFLFIVCACNISIWRKVRKRNIALQHQNRAASQNQRLTKTLLFVSAISVLSWLPLVIANYLVFVQGLDIPRRFLFLYIIIILNFSNSF